MIYLPNDKPEYIYHIMRKQVNWYNYVLFWPHLRKPVCDNQNYVLS